MYNRSWRAIPLLLLSASCMMPGKQAGAPRVSAGADAGSPGVAKATAGMVRRVHIETPAMVPPVPALTAAGSAIEELAAPVPLPVAKTRSPGVVPAVFRFPASSSDDRARSLECLTEAVYYEARSEPLQGQRAVAQVVLNRVRHPAFPNSVCGVVFQGAERRTGCQFSFTCDGSRYRPREQGAWNRARDVAEAALEGAVDPDIGYSTHFHTNAVSPWWKRSLRFVASVGSHIFYGWKGQQGTSARFDQRYAGREPGAEPPVVSVRSPVVRPKEKVVVEDVAVTIHRGSLESPVETAQEADSGSVRVHRGSAPALPQLAEEPHEFGVRVHRSAT